MRKERREGRKKGRCEDKERERERGKYLHPLGHKTGNNHPRGLHTRRIRYHNAGVRQKRERETKRRAKEYMAI